MPLTLRSLLASWRRFLEGTGKPTPVRLTGVNVVMYTRVGCHLCEDAWTYLVQEQQRWGYDLRQEDVDRDPELRSRFGECVPVVTVDGKLRFRGKVNPVLFQRLMHALAHPSAREPS